MSLTPLFFRALTIAHIFVRFLKPFFSTSLFTSTCIPLPWPCSRPSTLSRIANTSPTTDAALALQDRPHSREFLIECSTVDAVATIRPLFLSTTFAVMYFNDMNNRSTYLFKTVIV
ncbi:hypothetical protein CISIN_1g033617mg [Citrus sinensis]|uniref:Uncharacterized protein n=1 Tax=Citrus sinensis TaxID=2711 RepID=A0A067EFW8_CITSI|nr:hypothetical protein CISIN_1g033617mg [Citrus sinensis]